MIRNARASFAPLILLLAFEIGAIVALQALGGSPSMRVQWNDFGSWINAYPLDQVVPPLVRVTALAVAYWMFLSTALFVVAQFSRIPSAIKFTSSFTLPSVRRVVDGAMAVSIATTAVLGASAGAASAATPAAATAVSTQELTNNRITLGVNANTQVAVPVAQINVNDTDDGAVPTPSLDPVESTTTTTAAPSTTTTTEAPTTTTTAAPTPTTAAPTTTTAAPTPAPGNGSTNGNGTVKIDTSGQSGYVKTPRPAAPVEANTMWVSTNPTPVATPKVTAAPAAPAAEAPAPAAPVADASQHRVVDGENLWSISRAALVDAGNTNPSESQVRDYWLKVIEANKGNLRSGDPHWIYAGETVQLPAQ